MRKGNQDGISRESLIYAFAHCETWLEDYAKSQKLPAHELTERVAGLLFAQTSGEILGTEHRVSALPREATKRNSATRKVAVAKRPYRKTQIEKTRTFHMVPCKYCTERLLSSHMGNHVRYNHPKQARAA